MTGRRKKLTEQKGGKWFSALGISKKYPPRLVINAAFKSNPADISLKSPFPLHVFCYYFTYLLAMYASIASMPNPQSFNTSGTQLCVFPFCFCNPMSPVSAACRDTDIPLPRCCIDRVKVNVTAVSFWVLRPCRVWKTLFHSSPHWPIALTLSCPIGHKSSQALQGWASNGHLFSEICRFWVSILTLSTIEETFLAKTERSTNASPWFLILPSVVSAVLSHYSWLWEHWQAGELSRFRLEEKLGTEWENTNWEQKGEEGVV